VLTIDCESPANEKCAADGHGTEPLPTEEPDKFTATLLWDLGRSLGRPKMGSDLPNDGLPLLSGMNDCATSASIIEALEKHSLLR
jgi:hypothetical protein